MRFVDTNIIIRYLTQDDPAKSEACFAFFQDVRAGRMAAMTCEAVISEVVYVLSSRATYHLARSDIRARLTPVLQLTGLKMPHRQVYLRALDLYVDYPALDFEDALCVAHMHHASIGDIVSYDRDFDRATLVTRHEPVGPHEDAGT